MPSKMIIIPHTNNVELPVNQPHSLKVESDNPHDWRAIKVTDRSTDAIQAYFTRGSRSLIRPICEQELISGEMILKLKVPAKRVGYKMTQKCAIGLFAKVENVEKITNMFHGSGLLIEMI